MKHDGDPDGDKSLSGEVGVSDFLFALFSLCNINDYWVKYVISSNTYSERLY